MYLNFKSPLLRQFAVVITANFSIFCLGMNIIWASPMVIKLQDPEQTPLSRPITVQEQAWLVTIQNIVSMPLLFLSGYVADSLGRKWSLVICIFPRLVMSMFILFGTEMWMILLGRAISGWGDILTLSVVSTYTSEVAGKETRGASGTTTQILSASGMLVMYGIGPFVSYMVINILMLALTVVVYIPMMFIPESPYFLFTKGKIDEATKVLIYLRGTEEKAKEELELYNAEKSSNPTSTSGDQKSLESGTESAPNKWVLLKDRTVLKSLVIALYLPVGAQLIGYNVVNNYLQSIFEIANTSISSEISSLIIGFIQLFACSVTFFITDRFGRKPILCIALVVIAIGAMGLGIFFLLVERGFEITGFANYIPLISVAFIVYGFNAGYGSLLWIVLAELLDSSLRSYGMSAGILFSMVIGITIQQLFPAILASGGSWLYWMFAGFCAFNCFFIAFLVPETKGKSFVEIQRAFGRIMVEPEAKEKVEETKASS